MKPTRILFILCFATLLAACNGAATTPAATVSAPTIAPATVASAATTAAIAATLPPTSQVTQQATQAATSILAQFVATDPGSDVSVGLSNPTPAATRAILSGTPDSAPLDTTLLPNATAGATAVVVTPLNAAPAPTLADLVKQFPDLAPYVNSAKSIDNMDLADLYKKMIEVYTKTGGTGLAVFLKESGLLQKFNLPASYLDLLMVYDKGGLSAVEKLAKDRGLINSKSEIVAYLTLKSPDALDQVTSDMGKLGVTAYPPLDGQGRLQIGIPLDTLSSFQTPGTLIQYLSKVAHIANVTAVNPPIPRQPAGKVNLPAYKGRGPQTVGASAWQKAGITGKGVRIGVLDMGFGGIKALMNGKDLPTHVQSNLPLNTLDAQEETHGADCAQIVHGAAPDADMFVAYFDDNASFNGALQYLLDNKVQIISYSIGSTVGPRDGTFGEALTVDRIVQKDNVLWVVAAGNEALDHATFKYNDSVGDGQHHFDSKTDSLPFIAGAPQTSVVMNWDGNWNGGEQDEYDFSILDDSNNEVATAAEPVNGRRHDYPFQSVTFDSTPGSTYYMVIRKAHAVGDNTFDIFINNGLLPKWARVPDHSISVPADSSSALTIGATQLTRDVIEPYSSEGPTTDDRIKPDVTAPDNEVLPDVPDGFAGTSGATPLVAGAAALVLQAYPNLSAPEVKAYLMTNIADLGSKGADSVYGTGRLKLPNPSTINTTDGPDTSATAAPNATNPAVTSTSPANANATAKPISGVNPPSAGTPVATINSSQVRFNVVVAGVRNTVVSVSFEVDNFKGRQGMVALQIFQADGTTPVAPKTSAFLISQTLGVGIPFKPAYLKASYTSLLLSLPNSEFSNLSPGTHKLVYIITILDATDPNNMTVITQSAPVPITIKR